MRKKINLLFCLVFIGFSALAQTVQNPIWSLPGKFFDATSLYSLPTGVDPPFDYDGSEQATRAHNAMHDANEELMFFVIDDKIYDKEV